MQLISLCSSDNGDDDLRNCNRKHKHHTITRGHWFYLSMLCKLTIYIHLGLAHHSFLNSQLKTLKMRKPHLLSRPVIGRWPGFLAWFLDIFHPQTISALKIFILVISFCHSLDSLEFILWRSNLYSRTFSPLRLNSICLVTLVHQSKAIY